MVWEGSGDPNHRPLSRSTRSPSHADDGSRAQLPTGYSSPSANVVLSGAAKPGSRPHHWQLTTAPGTVSSGNGVPPRVPAAKEFMSIVYTPEQSFAGGKLPPELSFVV